MKIIYVAVLILTLPQISFSQIFSTKKDTAQLPGIELGEIVISGSKNDMQLKNLPSSVTLLTQTTIQDDNLKNLTDVSSIAPSLFMPSYGSKLTSPIYIRGIGSRINAPAVGLYVDNIPYFDKSSFNFDFFDVERIEILKGPQGTLYGRNTIGGVINIKTISPMDFQGIKAQIGVGSYGQYEAKAGFYKKHSNKLATSITTLYKRKDGFYTNDFLNKPVDDSEVYSIRGKLIWKPTSQLTLQYIASFEDSYEGAYPYSIYDSIKRKAQPILHNDPSSYKRDMFANALVAKYKTDNIELRLTSSMQYIDDKQEIDQDFSSSPIYFVIQNQKQIQFANEFIIRSVNKPSYNWLFGAFIFQQEFDKNLDVKIYSANKHTLKAYDHTITGQAIFHQSEYTAGNLTLTGGIRIDIENDEQKYNYATVVNENTNVLTDTTTNFNFFEILPKLAANYRFNGTNVFASIARGYKTGGYNTSFDEDRPQDMTYKSEYSMNYEMGLKTSLINKQLYADIALYFIDWDQQQIYQTNPSGIGSRLTNAGRSTSTGGEISIKTIPFCGYVTSMSYGYNHATFKSYVVDENLNYNGNFIPYAPRHTISVRISKTYELHNSNVLDKIRINLLYTGLGKTYWNEENNTSQKFYNLISTKVSFIKGEFALNFWRKNLLETEYHTFSFQSRGNTYVQNEKPSHYGIGLSYNF